MGQLVPISRKTNLNIAICPRIGEQAVTTDALLSMSQALEDFDDVPDLFLDSFETLADLFDELSLIIMQTLKKNGAMSADCLAKQMKYKPKEIESKLISLYRVGCLNSVKQSGPKYYYTCYENIRFIGTLKLDA